MIAHFSYPASFKDDCVFFTYEMSRQLVLVSYAVVVALHSAFLFLGRVVCLFASACVVAVFFYLFFF